MYFCLPIHVVLSCHFHLSIHRHLPHPSIVKCDNVVCQLIVRYFHQPEFVYNDIHSIFTGTTPARPRSKRNGARIVLQCISKWTKEIWRRIKLSQPCPSISIIPSQMQKGISSAPPWASSAELTRITQNAKKQMTIVGTLREITPSPFRILNEFSGCRQQHYPHGSAYGGRKYHGKDGRTKWNIKILQWTIILLHSHGQGI